MALALIAYLWSLALTSSLLNTYQHVQLLFFIVFQVSNTALLFLHAVSAVTVDFFVHT